MTFYSQGVESTRGQISDIVREAVLPYRLIGVHDRELADKVIAGLKEVFEMVYEEGMKYGGDYGTGTNFLEWWADSDLGQGL